MANRDRIQLGYVRSQIVNRVDKDGFKVTKCAKNKSGYYIKLEKHGSKPKAVEFCSIEKMYEALSDYK